MTIKTRVKKLEQAKNINDMLIVPMNPYEDEDTALMRHTGGKGDEGRFVVFIQRFSECESQ